MYTFSSSMLERLLEERCDEPLPKLTLAYGDSPSADCGFAFLDDAFVVFFFFVLALPGRLLLPRMSVVVLSTVTWTAVAKAVLATLPLPLTMPHLEGLVDVVVVFFVLVTWST